MRPSSLAYILLGVLIFSATYRILNQSPFPNIPTDFDASERHPFEQKSDPLATYKDEARLQDGDVASANVNPDELAIAKDKAQLEDRNQSPTNQPSDLEDVKLEDRNQSPTNQSSDLKDVKQNLSYLAYYAYSEVPPETKPADTVLKSLEDTPRGTPVEEIKRVSDAFGLDFNFMKAVAKVESGFSPSPSICRLGSPLGLGSPLVTLAGYPFA